MDTGKFTAGGNPEMDKHPFQGKGGEEILVVASCYRNQDKIQQTLPYLPIYEYNIWFVANSTPIQRPK